MWTPHDFCKPFPPNGSTLSRTKLKVAGSTSEILLSGGRDLGVSLKPSVYWAFAGVWLTLSLVKYLVPERQHVASLAAGDSQYWLFYCSGWEE